MVTSMVTMSTSGKTSSDGEKESNGLVKKLKFLEEDRVRSFKYWQYNETDNCSIKKMAEAGFYFSGGSEDDDSATCFVCGKVLDGWESTDDPWSEHEKHAPNCSFVKMHFSQDDLTVEQLFDLAALVIKNHAENVFNKKMAYMKKQVNGISADIKSQQM